MLALDMEISMTTKSFSGKEPYIEMRSVGSLRPYPGNARRHSKRQVKQIAESIQRFGFTNPVWVSDEGEIIAGWKLRRCVSHP
jgi:hypothetical protein